VYWFDGPDKKTSISAVSAQSSAYAGSDKVHLQIRFPSLPLRLLASQKLEERPLGQTIRYDNSHLSDNDCIGTLSRAR
jgi:hypothetical protein